MTWDNNRFNRIATWIAFYACTIAAGASAWIWPVGRDTWFMALAHPAAAPPNWLFAPVWTLLYLLMATAAYRIMWASPRQDKPLAMALWALQMCLNTLWTPVFFGAHALGAALIIILLLWGSIAKLIWFTARVDDGAALLLAPYLAWVSFATYLNWAYWSMN